MEALIQAHKFISTGSSFSKTTTGDEVVREFSKQIEGKTIVITGASKGSLGAATAISLAHSHPAEIILPGRTEAKITPVLEEIRKINGSIKVAFFKFDLADQSTIRSAAATINARVEKIDILVNCAGVMAVKDFQTTVQGIESQFGLNHVGPFLFTKLLLPKVVKAGKGARVVNVTSTGYMACGVRFNDWNFQDGKEYDPWLGYGQSKTANVLFAGNLADRLEESGGQAFSAHPGLVLESNLQANVAPELFAEGMEAAKKANGGVMPEMETPKTLQQGCSTILVAALDPSIAGSSGSILLDCQAAEIPVEYAKGADNKQKVWELSEKLVLEKSA